MESGIKPGSRKNDSQECICGFTEIIEDLPIGLFRLSPLPGYPLCFANRTLASMLGYGSPSELLGRPAHDFISQTVDIAPIRDELLSRGVLGNTEVPLVRKDGSEIRVLMSAMVRYAPDQTIIQIEGFCEDITERSVLEMEMQYHDTELNRYALALSQANKKLNLLQTITRHDILNQLSALGMYLEMARDSGTDPTQMEYLMNSEKATESIRHQIEFTRDYQDIGVASPQWYDVEKTIKNAISTLHLGDVTVDIDIHGLTVYADPLFEKVFYNLVENALRHAEGMTRIKFSYNQKETTAVIVCEDNGPGVPAEYKEAIFRREHFKHTGFGLFLSREILGITGLTIKETGTPGTGARFEITLPRDFFRIDPQVSAPE